MTFYVDWLSTCWWMSSPGKATPGVDECVILDSEGNVLSGGRDYQVADLTEPIRFDPPYISELSAKYASLYPHWFQGWVDAGVVNDPSKFDETYVNFKEREFSDNTRLRPIFIRAYPVNFQSDGIFVDDQSLAETILVDDLRLSGLTRWGNEDFKITPPRTIKYGSCFLNWKKSGTNNIIDFSTFLATIETINTTVVAQWDPRFPIITFLRPDGEVSTIITSGNNKLPIEELELLSDVREWEDDYGNRYLTESLSEIEWDTDYALTFVPNGSQNDPINITFDSSPGYFYGDINTVNVSIEQAGLLPSDLIPAKPKLSGHTFRGWYIQTVVPSGLEFPFVFDPNVYFPKVRTVKTVIDFNTYEFTEDVTLFALYEKNDPSVETPGVKFHVGDEILVTLDPDENGMILEPPVPPDQSNRVFVGWSFTDSITTLVNFSTMIFNTPEHLWAVYGVRSDVTFDASPGYFEDEDGQFSTVTVETDVFGKVNFPDIPYAGVDMEFQGWYIDDPETVIDLSTYIFINDVTLHAKWLELESRITFDPNGGGWEIDGEFSTDPKIIGLGTDGKPTAIPENPVRLPTDRNSFDFLGWTTVLNDAETLITDISEFSAEESMTLYALWKTLVTIILDANGGLFLQNEESFKLAARLDQTQVSYTIDTGSSLNDIVVPDVYREHYIFKVWAKDSEGNDIVSENIKDIIWEENTTLYAIWEAQKTVTFNAAPGVFENGSTTLIEYAVNGKVSPPANPKRTGYDFDGWSLEENGDTPIIFSDYEVIESITVYPIWTQISAFVTFNPDGGSFVSGTDPISIQADMSGHVQPPASPAREGHEFLGWGINPGSPDLIDFSTQVFDVNTTVYAIWNKIIIVTFDANNGYFATSTTKTVRAINNKVSPPEEKPVRNGYIFKGYGLTAESVVPIDFSTELFEDSATVYAIWKLIVIVSFETNGGSFPDGRESIDVIASDTGIVTPPQSPVKNGYKFKGWSMTINGTTPINFSTQIFEELKTVWAIWEQVFVSTIHFGFYDSMNGDRRYDANDISTIFDGILPEGIISTINHYLEIEKASNGLRVIVKSGRAFLDHTWNHNNGDIQLTFARAHASLTRYDAVVLEVNRKTRTNHIKILTGTPSNNPSYPQFSTDPLIKQYCLAYIRIKPNAVTISDSDIDIQIGRSIPFVYGVMAFIPQSTFVSYYNNWRAQFDTYMDSMKRVISQTTINDMYSALANKVNKADKATVNTPTTNDTLYLTNAVAKQLLVSGLNPVGSIVATVNRNGPNIDGDWANNGTATSLGLNLYAPLFWRRTF